MNQRPSLQEFLREVGDLDPVGQPQTDPECMKDYLQEIIDFHTKFPTVQFEQFLVTKEEFTTH